MEDDDGPNYYTSASDSDDSDDETVEARLDEKAREKRQRLRKERDLLKPKYFFGEKEAREEAERKGGRARTRGPKGNRGVPVFMPTCVGPPSNVRLTCHSSRSMVLAQDGPVSRLLQVHRGD